MVNKEQVDAASLKATLDTAMALLDVFLLGKAAGAAGSLAKVAILEKSVAEQATLKALKTLEPAERIRALTSAIEDRGISRAVAETGSTVDELVEMVGKDTDLGRQLAAFAAGGAKSLDELGAKLTVLRTLAKDEAKSVAAQSVESFVPAETLRRVGGFDGLASVIGEDTPALQKLDSWRGGVAREAEAVVTDAGADEAKAAARAALGARSGLADDIVENLLGLEIMLLGDWLQQGEGGMDGQVTSYDGRPRDGRP